MFKNTIRTSAFVILTMFATNTVFSASSVRQLNVAGSAKTSSATPAVTPARVSTASIIASKAKSATPMITNTTTTAKKTTAARLSTPVNVAKSSDSVRLVGTAVQAGNRGDRQQNSSSQANSVIFKTSALAQKNQQDIADITNSFENTTAVLVNAINQKAGSTETAAEINSVRDDLTSSINSAINDVRDDMLTSNNLDYELNKSNVLLQMNDNINTKASASEVTGLTQRTVDLESAFSKDGNGDMKVKSDALPVMDMTKVNGLSDFYNAMTDEETGLAAVREKANAAKESADAAQESADAAVKTEELNSKIADYANDENGILVTKTKLSDALKDIPTDETIKGIQGDLSKLNNAFDKDGDDNLTVLKGDYLPDNLVKADKFKLRVQDGKFEYTKDNENWDKLLETSELGGTNGKSAFELWQENNPNGTEEEFWASLKGTNGCVTELTPTEIENGFKLTAVKKCDDQADEQLWSKDILNGQDGADGENGSNGTCAEGDIIGITQDTNNRNLLNLTYCGEEEPGGSIELPGGGEGGNCQSIEYSYTQPSMPIIPIPTWVSGDYMGVYYVRGKKTKTITDTCTNNVETETTDDVCDYYGQVVINNTTFNAHTCTTQPVTGTATRYYLITNGLQAPTGDCNTTYTDPSEKITPSPEWVTNINDGNIGAYMVVGKTTIDCGSNNVETIDDRCVFYGWLNGDGNRASVHQCKTASTGKYYYLVTDGLPAATSIASMMDSRYPVLGTYFPGGRLSGNFAPTNMVTEESLALVAKTGKYTDLENTPTFAAVATSGNYSDLTNKPTLATVATSGNYSDLTNKPTLATVATSGNYSDLSNKPTLSAVATSGNYTDLTGTPDLSSFASQSSVNSLINALNNQGVLCYNPNTSTFTTPINQQCNPITNSDAGGK